MTDRLIQITPSPLDAVAVIARVSDGSAGGIAVFLGTTRQEKDTQGRDLVALDYEAYVEMAQKQMEDLANETQRRWPVVKVALVHRTGRVPIGEPSVMVAVSCPHRADAFDACRWLIDSLKKDVAIWKKEIWDDGSGTWVHPEK